MPESADFEGEQWRGRAGQDEGAYGLARELKEPGGRDDQGVGGRAASMKAGGPSPAELVAVTQILAVGLLPASAGMITFLATGPPPVTAVALCFVYSRAPLPTS